MIHYSMPSVLTYPSGVSYFLQLLLTLLPPVALLTGPKWALQAQGHVFGICYESATWSRRCPLGLGTPVCWHDKGSDWRDKLTGSMELHCTFWVTHTAHGKTHTKKHFSLFLASFIDCCPSLSDYELITKPLRYKVITTIIWCVCILSYEFSLCVFGCPCSLIAMFHCIWVSHNQVPHFAMCKDEQTDK